MNDERRNSNTDSTGLRRRTVVKGIAWSVPVIAASVAAPAHAASVTPACLTPGDLVLVPNSFSTCAQSGVYTSYCYQPDNYETMHYTLVGEQLVLNYTASYQYTGTTPITVSDLQIYAVTSGAEANWSISSYTVTGAAGGVLIPPVDPTQQVGGVGFTNLSLTPGQVITVKFTITASAGAGSNFSTSGSTSDMGFGYLVNGCGTQLQYFQGNNHSLDLNNPLADQNIAGYYIATQQYLDNISAVRGSYAPCANAAAGCL